MTVTFTSTVWHNATNVSWGDTNSSERESGVRISFGSSRCQNIRFRDFLNVYKLSSGAFPNRKPPLFLFRSISKAIFKFPGLFSWLVFQSKIIHRSIHLIHRKEHPHSSHFQQFPRLYPEIRANDWESFPPFYFFFSNYTGTTNTWIFLTKG